MRELTDMGRMDLHSDCCWDPAYGGQWYWHGLTTGIGRVA